MSSAGSHAAEAFLLAASAQIAQQFTARVPVFTAVQHKRRITAYTTGLAY